MRLIKSNRRNHKTLEQFIKALDLSQDDMNKPMNIDSSDPVLGITNAYSKATCLVLYLYSMEFGTPQLFAEANRVSRDIDTTQIRELGPFL